MKIYTKTGDRGDTRLFDGTKVRKHNERVDAYGDVDELNSFIGAAASFLKDASLASMLAEVQKDLFSVGAQLADPGFKNQSRAKFQIVLKRNYGLCVNSFSQAEETPARSCMSRAPFAGVPSAASSTCRKASK